MKEISRLLLRIKLVRYLVSGGTAALINFLLLFALTEFLEVWYLASAVIAFIVSFCASFTLQKFWTFQDRGTERIGGQVTKYFLLFLFNLGLSTGVVYLLVEYIQIAPIIAQLFAAATIACYSFFVYKFFVFHRDQDPQQPEGQDAA